jgi:hypothetical protein
LSIDKPPQIAKADGNRWRTYSLNNAPVSKIVPVRLAHRNRYGGESLNKCDARFLGSSLVPAG